MPAFLLDMDGVLYRGPNPILSAIPFLNHISSKYPVLFLTNNSSITPEAVSAKLLNMGFTEQPPDRVLTSALATATFLASQKPGFSYFAVGGPGLHHALLKYGGKEDTSTPDYVVIGEGRGLDYDGLTTGLNVIRKGAKLIGTNPDVNLDAGDGTILPGGGALVAPFAVGSQTEPVFIGKPASHLYLEALRKLGMGPEGVVMVGDRPDTDIAGAVATGIATVLVRTGRFAPGEEYPPDLPKPDFDINDLSELDFDKLVAFLEERAQKSTTIPN